MKRLVLAVICIFLCLGIQAVNTFPFRHIGIRDGLPDNYVKMYLEFLTGVWEYVRLPY